MNITDSVANQIGGNVKELIEKTPEIQFYANEAIEQYQWRDSRFPETSSVWENPTATTRKELIEIFHKHVIEKHS